MAAGNLGLRLWAGVPLRKRPARPAVRKSWATARVARRHYLQVTEADFEKATSNPTSPMHADGRTGQHAEKETAVSPANADYTAVHVPSTGIEPVTFSSGG